MEPNLDVDESNIFEDEENELVSVNEVKVKVKQPSDKNFNIIQPQEYFNEKKWDKQIQDIMKDLIASKIVVLSQNFKEEENENHNHVSHTSKKEK